MSGSKGWFLALFATCLFASPLAASSGWRAFGFRQADSATNHPDEQETLGGNYPSLRGLVVARGDCVVYEYYRRDVSLETRSPIYSVTKSLLSILVGMAVDSGYLRLDQTLGEMFTEAAEKSVDPRVREITVRDLLTMTSGFDSARSAGVEVQVGAMWRWMLDRPLSHSPGTHFAYDGVSVNLLSVVLAKALHQNSARFAQQSLFDRLRIEDVGWTADSEGHLIGDAGLRLTAREMARIGLLYLQKGKWKGEQIVSEAYVRDSTTRHNDGGPPVDAAYGYLWWIGFTRDNQPTFFAAGHDSQLILVIPDRDLVVAVAAEGLPGGSRHFVDESVLPIMDSLPSSASCIARLQ